MIFNAGQRRGETGPKLPPVGQALESYSWSDIDAISKAGKASEYFLVGDTKSVAIGNTEHTFEVIGFNHDDLADGSGKAGITFGIVDCYTSAKMHNGGDPTAVRTTGGWFGDLLLTRPYLRDTVFPELPSDLREVIKTVAKKAGYGGATSDIVTGEDTIFLFSQIEIEGTTSHSPPGEGRQYAKFTTSASRIKKHNGTAKNWWLRSPYPQSSNAMSCITTGGTVAYRTANNSYGIVFGFCV